MMPLQGSNSALKNRVYPLDRYWCSESCSKAKLGNVVKSVHFSRFVYIYCIVHTGTVLQCIQNQCSSSVTFSGRSGSLDCGSGFFKVCLI